MLHLLLTYKYFILVPLAIIEGPIVTIICGFLVTMKVFNPIMVYVAIVISDIIGDGMVYYIGYSGKRFLHYFKITQEKLEQSKTYFKENHNKTLIISKLVHGIGFIGLIAAGASHVPYARYIRTCTLVSIVQSLILLLIGILFGHAYVIIGKYLNHYANLISIAVLVVVAIVLIRKYKDKIGKKIGS